MIVKMSRFVLKNVATLSLLFSPFLGLVTSDCMPDDLSIEERLSLEPVVLRVIKEKTEDGDLPCPVNVYNGTAYALQDTGFATYKVLEIFMSSFTMEVGDAIKILHDTDTGYYTYLPQYLVDESFTDGFLAFLSPLFFCYDQEPAYPADWNISAKEYPFLLNECITANKPWSAVSLEDAAMLRERIEGTAGIPNEDGSSSDEAPSAAYRRSSRSWIPSLVSISIFTVSIIVAGNLFDLLPTAN